MELYYSRNSGKEQNLWYFKKGPELSYFYITSHENDVFLDAGEFYWIDIKRMILKEKCTDILNVVANHRKGSLILVALLLMSVFSFGQVSDGSTPASFNAKLKAAEIIPQKALDALDIAELKATDVQEGVNNRYGVLQAIRNNFV